MIYYLHGVTVGASPDLTRYFGKDNLANYEDSEALEILEEIYNITDEKILKEKYIRLQNIYEEYRMYIGLYFSRIAVVYGKNLSMATANNWYNVFYDIENWHGRK